MSGSSTPSAPLPASADRYELSPSDYVAAMTAALPLLSQSGTSLSHADLAAIAEAGNLPPQHSLVNNTQALYEEALRFALSTLWPTNTPVDSSSKLPEDIRIPAEALRQLVTDTMQRFQANPEAVRLLIMENMFNLADVDTRMDVLEQSPVILQLDRVLMRGHDLGAFRTGVSAEDVYALLLSIASFSVSHRHTFFALYEMDADQPHNRDGLIKLACDAVLAFLTIPLPSTSASSYTHYSPNELSGAPVSASLYGSEDSSDISSDASPNDPDYFPQLADFGEFEQE